MKGRWRWCLSLGAGVLVVSASLGVVGAASASSTKSPIELGFIGDLTGAAASTFANGPAGAQARIDVQNAEGGVDGHQLKMIVSDTQSSPSSAATAAENLVETDHVFGIMENSALFFGAAPYLLKAGVPVTGTGIDGPEWSSDANLFDASGPPINGPVAGHLWTTTTTAEFFKGLGATKVAFIAAETPSSTDGIDATLTTFPKAGLTNCYQTTLPLGGINVTTDVLAIKNAGCDGLYVSNVDDTAVAFGQGLKNAGYTMKAAFLGEGYDNTVLDSATNRGFGAGRILRRHEHRPQLHATKHGNREHARRIAQIRQIVSRRHPGFSGCSAAGRRRILMILGLEHAGSTPTRATFMSDLHKDASYDAGGLLPLSWGFTHFGTAQMIPKTTCSYYFQMEGSHFVTANHGKPYCGTYVETDIP